MRHHNAPPERWHCAERLESRRLLSGAVVDAAGAGFDEAALVSVATVEVIELSPGDEEEEEQEVAVDPAELPAEVLAALAAAYPSAQILEAEMEEEDGAIEYDVSTRHQGRLLEVGFTPLGEVIEVSQVLAESALPPAVLAWLEANFAGAELAEIELVSEGGFTGYELQIVPEGGAPVEATIRVSAPAGNEVDEPQAVPVRLEPVNAPATSGDAVLPLDEETEGASANEQPVARDGPAPPASEPLALHVPLDSAAAIEAPVPTAEAEPALATAARDGEAAQAPPSMPELAMLLGLSALELADLDHELGQLLAEIQKLAQGLDGGEPLGNAGLAVALVLILIAGAQVFRPDPAPRPAQGMAFMKAHGDCSWSSWSATTMRR